MLTLLEIIRRSEEHLAKRGIERARREAEEFIADALHLKRLDLYLQFDRLLNKEELVTIRTALKRRAEREPTAYIAGQIEFGGLTLKVTPDVLIPRPETEILVEKIASQIKAIPLENKILWDVCCGSGCIGLALKKRFPELTVYLSDLSARALEIAKLNGGASASCLQGDLFEPFKNNTCDFFVCNPPYVTEKEYEHLDPEVKEWEPKLALISGVSGLEFYARIARELKNYLNPNGLGWLEIGAGQGLAVQSLFENEGWRCHYEQDWSGHDRFFFLQI